MPRYAVIDVGTNSVNYRGRSVDDRRRVVGLQPQRADVILAGACIIKTVMAKLGKDSLLVSDHGLRHGLLVERFG